MKNIFITLAVALAFCFTASADDRPVDFGKLPDAAKDFVTTYYAQDKVISVTKDDDFVAPDYEVVLDNGTVLQFSSSGVLEKIEAFKEGVPVSLIPKKIQEYVSNNYQGVFYREYEIDRGKYEVKLSNGLELTFNNAFTLIEIDY